MWAQPTTKSWDFFTRSSFSLLMPPSAIPNVAASGERRCQEILEGRGWWCLVVLTDIPELVLREGCRVSAVVQFIADQRAPAVRHSRHPPSMLETSECCRTYRVGDAPAELVRIDWLRPHCWNTICRWEGTRLSSQVSQVSFIIVLKVVGIDCNVGKGYFFPQYCCV